MMCAACVETRLYQPLNTVNRILQPDSLSFLGHLYRAAPPDSSNSSLLLLSPPLNFITPISPELWRCAA